MRPAPLVVVLLFMAVALAGCTSPDEAAGHSVPWINHRPEPRLAPDFTVTTLDNETFTLSDQKGQVVLVYFMGLSCTSCRANLPAHKEFAAAYANESRFVFVGLNSWASLCGERCPTAENETNMRTYVDREGITWPLAFADEPTIDAFDVRGTPSHYFIDHEGREHAFGAKVPFESLQAETDFLLARIG